jgi:Rrf2 family protein
MPRLVHVPEAASLALHSMAVLAGRPRDIIPAREIAEALRASEAHLAKVLRRLEISGFVKSTRGPKGGHVLAVDPAKITLKQIYEAVEGPISPARCLLETPICAGDKCVFGKMLENLDRQLRKHLAETTLSQIALAKEVRHA